MPGMCWARADRDKSRWDSARPSIHTALCTLFVSLVTASCVHRQPRPWRVNAVPVEALTVGSTPVEATLSTSRVVRVRDLLTNRVITQFKIGPIRWNDYEEGPPFVLSADAHLLAIGAGDGRIEVRNAMTGTLLRTFRALPTLGYVLDRSMPGRFGTAEDPVTGLAFAGDTLLAATTLDRQVMVWNGTTFVGQGRISATSPETVPALPSALAFSGGGRTLAAGPDQTVSIHRVPGLDPLTWLGAGRPPRVLAFGATGDFIAIATTSGYFGVASTNPRPQSLWYVQATSMAGTALPSQPLAVAFGPGDASVAGVDGQGSVVVWQTVTGREEARFALPAAQTSAAIEIRTDAGVPRVRVAIPAGVYEFAAPASPPLEEQWAARRASADSVILVTPVAVTGIVQDLTTGRPVAGVVVGHGAPWVGSSPTDPSGRFALGSIRPGMTGVRARCPSRTGLGALALDTMVVVPRGEPLALDLRIDATRCNEPAFAHRPIRVRGVYTAGFEESEFVPCKDTSGVFREIWGNPLGASVVVSGIKPRLHWPPAGPSVYGSGYSTWYVDWSGTLTGPGRYAYGTYELQVSSIYAVRTNAPRRCRLIARRVGGP